MCICTEKQNPFSKTLCGKFLELCSKYMKYLVTVWRLTWTHKLPIVPLEDGKLSHFGPDSPAQEALRFALRALTPHGHVSVCEALPSPHAGENRWTEGADCRASVMSVTALSHSRLSYPCENSSCCLFFSKKLDLSIFVGNIWTINRVPFQKKNKNGDTLR